MTKTRQEQVEMPRHTLWHLIYRLWVHLGPKRHRQFMMLAALTLINACAEVISLSAVLPFMGVLIAPDKVFGYSIVQHAALVLGITSADQLVLPITIAFAVAALVAGAIRILLVWANTRYAFASGAELGIEMYRRTLYQPYQAHLARNSSELISSSSKVNTIIFGVLLPLLSLITSVVLLVAITVALFVIDAIAAGLAIAGFVAAYVVIGLITRRRLQHNSERMARESTSLIKVQQEALGGIRDILLDGTQMIYCDAYNRANQSLRAALGTSTFIGASPRYLMETVGMLLIIALTYGLNNHVGGIAKALPVLGALALGAQRLIPNLQQSYSAWVSIVSTRESLADVVGLLEQPMPADALLPAPAPLPLLESIRLDAIGFRYSGDTPWVLDGLNLTIPKGARIGIVGSTGSGKSTTLDLLMGLLSPTRGALLVDGQPVSGTRVRAWQKNIAHVPQSIYLADTTLAENIAFGVARDAIDMDRVRQAARQAQIADFIENRPEGYDAVVGERGIRLSGGQRQRIGIARALYKQANLLIFDEATSALDNATEQSVMNAIEGLNRNLTILLIAHRLTTVRRCDIIVELEHGKLVAQGTFEQLMESSSSFRQMAQAAG